MKFPSWESRRKWAVVVNGLHPVLPSPANATVGSVTSAWYRNAEVGLAILAVNAQDDLVAEVTCFEGVVGDVYGDLTIGDKVQANRGDLCSLHV